MGSRPPIPRLQQRDPAAQPPLDSIQWMYQMERDGAVRADDIAVAPRHQVLYSSEQEHTLAVIYYSNKSLAAPNFLWISISPRTYLHWSASGVRMCQASLTVTLKNGSEGVCMCVGGTVVGFVHMQHFCSLRLYDTNPWVWVITSENVRAARAKGDLRYCNSDAIYPHTVSKPDYEEQLNIILLQRLWL